jgi:hypothetical protein
MSSVGLGKGVGIPVKLMHESEGHVITVPLLHSFLSFSVSLMLFLCVFFIRENSIAQNGSKEPPS